MGPMMQFNTNMLEAAMHHNVKWYLYTSTVGVYQPAEVLREDDVWSTQPSKNDWFGGWAKRMGELQCQAYQKQYGEGKCSIVRPANVYGSHDNFEANRRPQKSL
jgi:GDP-L-fucose synthase